MLRSAIRVVAVLSVLLGAHSYAGQMIAQGKVLRVVPINARAHVIERSGDCESDKPSYERGLVALLSWDLRADCRTVRREIDVVEGYRVYYEWDDRVYDAVMSRRPADTIPLRVNLR
ncbi:MAG: hypothetical protein O7B25_16075 [Gammaproteobacteria bacterium]|nr:hypothetical protein [Gammaproteobacteria bacterium]